MRAGGRRRLVAGLVQMAAHQLHADEQEVGLNNVGAAVAMDFIKAAGLVKLLDLSAVDTRFARQADALEQQVKPAADPELTAVGEKVLEVEMMMLA